MRNWQVQEAKARFSELLREAAQDGPQAVTVRGKVAAVILSKSEYEKLKKRKPSLVDFLLASPLAGVELSIERDKSLPREVDL